jgi:preprotein translocase subunit SecB
MEDQVQGEAESEVEEHPIQLRSLNVRELHAKTHIPPDAIEDVDVGAYSISVGHSDFDEKIKNIQVGVKLEAGSDDPDDAPFSLTIELVGDFQVDDERFPVDHLDNWARENAPYILLPYLREHVYALTARCGLEPMILPLAVVPTKKQTED